MLFVKTTLSKDYISDMQLKLKSLEKFLTEGCDDLIEEAVRLELAGITPTSKGNFPIYRANLGI